MKRLYICFSLLLYLLIGCKREPTAPANSTPPPEVVNGVYILNEGDFTDPTGARLSLYDIDRDIVFRDVFESANGGQHLGNLGDDIKLYDGKAYLLMSGSENINVISLSDHKLIQSATFPGATPHDLLLDSTRNKAYVTRLFSNSILVLDLASLDVIDSVQVGSNPLGMALAGGQLYVCNSGFGLDRTVTVVDASADTVKTTLVLADGPTVAAVAPDGKIWVVCTGNAFGSPPTNGRIVVIDPATNAVEDSVVFADVLWGALAITNGYVYAVSQTSFFGGPIRRINRVTKSMDMNFINDTTYAFGVDELLGDIYIADAKRFESNGEVKVYTSAGVFKKKFEVQRGPGAIAIKRQL